jgi:hypothetical protein
MRSVVRFVVEVGLGSEAEQHQLVDGEARLTVPALVRTLSARGLGTMRDEAAHAPVDQSSTPRADVHR